MWVTGFCGVLPRFKKGLGRISGGEELGGSRGEEKGGVFFGGFFGCRDKCFKR